MKSCEICELLTTHNHGEDVQVVQTNNWRVVLDPNQRFLGKAFVTLLEHKQALSDLTSEDWIDFGALIRRLEIALRRTFRPSHFNWSCLMNIAASKGQPTHVHWHFHPRYDTTLVVAGESFTDANSYPLGGVIT